MRAASRSTRKSQRGSALVLIGVGMLALLATAALAFDVGHLTLNKARLQAAVDAAALAAAKTLLDQGSTVAATTAATKAANDAIDDNKPTFAELTSASSKGLTIAVDYSNTQNPFVPGSNPPKFVRVRAQNFNMFTTLAGVLGMNQLTTGARAVAGPQGTSTTTGGTVCNSLPVMMCANTAAGAPLWGYSVGQLVGLKNGANSNPAAAGPGNYYLTRLNGNGANVVRQNLAGAYEGCLTMGTSVETQPGVDAGPTKQGLNTRFNEYQGGGMNSTDFPPDAITTQPTPPLDMECKKGQPCTIQQNKNIVTSTSQIGYSHANNYIPRLPGPGWDVTPAPQGIARFKRREAGVPIVNCDGAPGGQSTFPIVGFACIFLLQKVVGGGTDAFIIGEIIKECDTGSPSAGPGTPSPSLSYKIVLYKDVGSSDS